MKWKHHIFLFKNLTYRLLLNFLGLLHLLRKLEKVCSRMYLLKHFFFRVFHIRTIVYRGCLSLHLSLNSLISFVLHIVLIVKATPSYLNTELCWLHSFLLYWLFPHGSQSSHIIWANFILESPKSMMELPSLR